MYLFSNRTQKTSKVVRTSVTHSAITFCATLCSYHILTSSVIYNWTDTQQHGIYLLNTYCLEKLQVNHSARQWFSHMYLVMKILLQIVSPFFCSDSLVLELFQVWPQKGLKHICNQNEKKVNYCVWKSNCLTVSVMAGYIPSLFLRLAIQINSHFEFYVYFKCYLFCLWSENQDYEVKY